jgi:hypothetical protein
MPAMWRSNCIILGSGHRPFVWASKRPATVLASLEFNAGKPTSADRRNHGRNVRSRAIQSSNCWSCLDQERVLTGVSFRATERFLRLRFHKAVAQFAASHPHCRPWRRESLRQVRSVRSRPPMPAIWQSSYTILVSSDLPVAWASNRPTPAGGLFEMPSVKPTFAVSTDFGLHPKAGSSASAALFHRCFAVCGVQSKMKRAFEKPIPLGLAARGAGSARAADRT